MTPLKRPTAKYWPSLVQEQLVARDNTLNFDTDFCSGLHRPIHVHMHIYTCTCTCTIQTYMYAHVYTNVRAHIHIVHVTQTDTSIHAMEIKVIYSTCMYMYMHNIRIWLYLAEGLYYISLSIFTHNRPLLHTMVLFAIPWHIHTHRAHMMLPMSEEVQLSSC